MADLEERDWQRLDKWLWCARFLRTRSDCALLAREGRLRINRQPTDKAHARLRVGDVITLALRGQVHVVEVLALAPRRGPTTEARRLYREIPPAERADALSCEEPQTAPYPAAEPDTRAR
jgi:ribosome-associated heat shock protein Hsp15